MSKRTRQLNLKMAATKLAQAQRIVIDMQASLETGRYIFDVTDLPAGGVNLLEQLKVIEVFDHDTLTHMDGEGNQQPRIVALARS